MPKEPESPIPQNFIKYNRESGNKTLIFVGIMITLIVIFTILSLILISKPKTLTSSIDSRLAPAGSLPQK